MDILKSFVLNGTEHSVNVLWKDEKPYFRATEIGGILGLKNVRETIRTFDQRYKGVILTDTAGGEQNITFLTERGLYKLLMTSRKPIAQPFQDWVTDVLETIRETGKYDLNKAAEDLEKEQKIREEAEIKLDALANQFKDVAEKSKHDSLIDSFSLKCVVYFGKIRALHDGVNLIKIGSTNNIRSRATGLIEDFGSMSIFHVIECDLYRQFERFLHQHTDIKKHAYKDVVHEGHKSTEVFALNETDLRKAISIAQHNVHLFRKTPPNIDIDEVQKLKHEVMELKKTVYSRASTSTSNIIDYDIDPLYVDPILECTDHRQYTQVKGDKVQRYSPDGKTLLFTYESMISVLRDRTIDSPSRTRIHQAVQDRTVYKDFRWMFLDRALPDDTIQELDESVYKDIDIRKGFVAMLNLDQTRIENVFPNQKEAGKDRKFRSSAPVCTSLKNGTQSGGHYFKMWYDCSEELKKEYLSRKGLPDKVAPGGKRVAKIHPRTREVVNVYASLHDVIKEHQFSYNSLRNVIKNELCAKGYYWAWDSTPIHFSGINGM
jgi:prophage antirepressor-like protein